MAQMAVAKAATLVAIHMNILFAAEKFLIANLPLKATGRISLLHFAA
jgi:hypothetical protein